MNIVILFLLFAIVLSYFVFTSRAKLAIKIVTVAFFFYMASGLYFAFDSYLGWPYYDQLLTKRTDFELVSAYVVQNSKDSKGAIYIWAKPLEDKFFEWRYGDQAEMYKPETVELTFTDRLDPRFMFTAQPSGKDAPRAFWTDYSEQLEQQLQEAMTAQQESGALATVRLGPKPEGEGDGNAEGHEGDQKEDGGGTQETDGQKKDGNGGRGREQYEKEDVNGVQIFLPKQKVKR